MDAPRKDFDTVEKIFFEDGNLLSETHLLNGLKHGRFTIYNPNGTPALSQDYVDDVAHGWNIIYNCDGECVSMLHYA